MIFLQNSQTLLYRIKFRNNTVPTNPQQISQQKTIKTTSTLLKNRSWVGWKIPWKSPKSWAQKPLPGTSIPSSPSPNSRRNAMAPHRNPWDFSRVPGVGSEDCQVGPGPCRHGMHFRSSRLWKIAWKWVKARCHLKCGLILHAFP